MQTLISYIKELLFRLDAHVIQGSLLSAIILALIFALLWWFLLALYYQSKMAKVRERSQKIAAVAEQESLHLRETLEAVTQQLHHSEQELSDKQQHVQQLENAQNAAQLQINKGLEQENQITDALASLQAGFFANESLPAIFDDDNASPWQRYSRLVNNELSSRLQGSIQDQRLLQQEITRLNGVLAENALAIQALQQKNTAQLAQISKLGQDLETQQSLVLEQQAQLSTVRTQTQEQANQSLEVSTALQSQNIAPPPTSEELNHPHEEAQPDVVLTPAATPESTSHQPEKNAKSILGSLKSVFKADTQRTTPETTETIVASASVESMPAAAQNDSQATAGAIVENSSTVAETLETPTPPSKLKSMFRFGKPSTAAEAAESAPAETLETPTPPSKLKSMFRFGKPSTAAEAAESAPAEALETPAPPSKLKSMFRFGKPSTAAEVPESAPAEILGTPAPPSKLKSMFRFGKPSN